MPCRYSGVGHFRSMKKLSVMWRRQVADGGKKIVVAIFALLVICGVQAAFGRIVEVSPEAKSFKLGALELAVLRDSGLVYSNYGAIFGLNAGPAAVTKVLGEAGASTNEVYF